ncbi:hypothetical protein BC938DRAFT_474117, partial [Jimgerdemannia flammicorona]
EVARALAESLRHNTTLTKLNLRRRTSATSVAPIRSSIPTSSFTIAAPTPNSTFQFGTTPGAFQPMFAASNVKSTAALSTSVFGTTLTPSAAGGLGFGGALQQSAFGSTNNTTPAASVLGSQITFTFGQKQLNLIGGAAQPQATFTFEHLSGLSARTIGVGAQPQSAQTFAGFAAQSAPNVSTFNQRPQQSTNINASNLNAMFSTLATQGTLPATLDLETAGDQQPQPFPMVNPNGKRKVANPESRLTKK